MATMTQIPSAAPTAKEISEPTQAIHRPQRPGMRPEGIGRFGSLIASTWRSNQSLMAWLLPQTSGPASRPPAMIAIQWPAAGWPEETTPHMKAQMGGNQVIGFSSSSTSRGAGRRMSLGEAVGAIEGAEVAGCVIPWRVWLTPLSVN